MSNLPIVIDVRTPEEYAEGHIEGALNLDINGPDFLHQLQKLDFEGNYLLHCRSGARSAHAAQIMTEFGFSEVADASTLAEAAEATGLEIIY